MEGIFKPESKTIEELFGDKLSYYKVPVYQRPYSWEEEHVDALWSDIFTAFENNKEDDKYDQNYFLGSIILTSDGNDTFNIIDGQQRMTTLIILFCVLRDLLKDNDTVEYGDITLEDIEESIIKKKARVFLNTHTKNQTEFEEEILKGIKFPEKFTKKDVENNKYMNTAIILREKVTDLLSINDKIGDYIDYLFKKVRLITITCSSQEFAIKLFQTLNARGMDLSPADLIKSHLMSNLSNEKHDQFLQGWIEIENIAKRLRENVGDIFNYYQYYSLAQNPKKNLYDEIIGIFGNEDPISIIYKLNKFTKYYESIIEENNSTLYSLFYLRHQIYWKSILITAKYENYEEYSDLLKLLRNYYYKYWIAGYTSQKIKQISFNIIGMIKNKASLFKIKNLLLEKEKNDNIYNRVKDNLKLNCYGEAWCKPILILLEYNLVDESNLLNYIVLDNKIHVEHVLPRNWKNNTFWNSLPENDEFDNYLNNIANLTLLSGTKNIRASDNDFNIKKDIYKGKGKDGITSFQLTQEISKSDKWGLQEIKLRQEELIKEIECLLELNNSKQIKIGY
ncbi:MAG: DUF262 domain-containing protein [Fusobacteriaceae bacterium]